jgi:hypothetical protein
MVRAQLPGRTCWTRCGGLGAAPASSSSWAVGTRTRAPAARSSASRPRAGCAQLTGRHSTSAAMPEMAIWRVGRRWSGVDCTGPLSRLLSLASDAAAAPLSFLTL